MGAKAFQIIVLGSTGGAKESDLSGYLCSPLASSSWFAFDAGSLLCGIELALEKGHLSTASFTDSKLHPAYEMLIKHIHAYLISHTHLDHIAGLVLNSQVDAPKSILGIDRTIDHLRDHIFNGKIWPNYGSEGVSPIHRYTYHRLPLYQSISIPHTVCQVEAFPLHHPRGYDSSAFLVSYEEEYILYIGDTASDEGEEEKRLLPLWQRIAPLVREKRLHGIFLECSYPHRLAAQVRFGHLDTHLMLQELGNLAYLVGGSLQGLKVLVTHRKESKYRELAALDLIRHELEQRNTWGIDFLFPQQGDGLVW